MARKSIVKLTNRNQLLDFFGEVGTNIARRSLNFSHQFGTAIDNGNQIFKVPTGVKIIRAPAGEGFEFRSAKIYRRNQSNLQTLSNSRSSAWSIAGRYHVFENPKIFSSSGITSSVVVC